MLRTSVLTGPGLFEELQNVWRDLATASPSATPFQTFEWQSTWYSHYGSFKEPRAFCVWEGDDLVGLMPFVRSPGPWRTLRPMGIGPSDYLHPLSRAGMEEPVARLLAEHLDQVQGVDLIDLHQLRETKALAETMAGSHIDQATCLVLDLPGTYDAYLETLGKSLRYDVRRLDKSLFQEGRATIEQANADSIDGALDILFEQHKLRWRKRGLPGAFLGKSEGFHRDWARKAASNRWLWLSILKLDGQPIGAIYAMVHGNTSYYYQAGFDPTMGAVSPGTLLVAHTIRRSIDEGQRHFDFMRGDEPYKRRWKPQHAYRNLRVVRPSSGTLGKLGSSWNRMGSKVESRVRARLEGRGLL